MIRIRNGTVFINDTKVPFAIARIARGVLEVHMGLPYHERKQSDWRPCTASSGGPCTPPIRERAML